MNKLKPCPFCGTDLFEIHIKIRGFTGKFEKSVAYEHPKVGCVLDEFQLLHEKLTDWNLRTQPENKPLTLEELRQMDGEPGYLVDLDCGLKSWVIVRAVRGDFILYDNGNVINVNDLHTDYEFYAHKPEQEGK